MAPRPLTGHPTRRQHPFQSSLKLRPRLPVSAINAPPTPTLGADADANDVSSRPVHHSLLLLLRPLFHRHGRHAGK
ncbi:hypothetical protein HU200_037111 [Digitaria exilis]|uniref:Uncharacterized protein n=1 Tax=Digitaria exilis TaxID=1010633 RepID=A0A835BFI3_9POAL|nr:hypothetical protein HU200_037111 [Digitaria exilis]